MTISTVSGTITSAVTLGEGSYGLVLTVETGGTLSGGLYGSPSLSGSNLVNLGSIGAPVYSVDFRNGGYIYNVGRIGEAGVSGIGVGLNDGTLVNYGTIGVAGEGVGVAGQGQNTITNAGAVYGADYGVVLSQGSTLLNRGSIASARVGIDNEAVSATIINYGAIAGSIDGINDAGGVLINAGTISGDSLAIYAHSAFTLTADPGAAFIGGVEDKAGTGVLVLGSAAASGTLDISSFSGFSSIAFAPGAAWTLEGSTTQLASGQDISGFAQGDEIILDGFTATSESFVSGTGLVLSDGTSSETLNITGDFSSLSISATGNGTEITAPCFCRGTRIATPGGVARVEDLRVGDLVNTATNGARRVRWIGRRAYDNAALAGNHLALPVKIRRHALGFNVPSRDLFVSPDHAVYEGGVLVYAWRLVNGVSITQESHVERVEYFHFELDTHDIVFAENTPVETFLDAECRARFELADGIPGSATQACRPRVEDGYYLERLRARINARAGLRQDAKIAGPVRGNLDERGARLRGWAQDEHTPEQPVELELLSDGRVVSRFLANRYRADLRRAGLGSGCHAFDVARPPGDVTVRRAGDAKILF